MKHQWIAAVVALALAATLSPQSSEAKRLGGGKPMGMQRQAPDRSAPPQNTPPSPAQPATPGAPVAGKPAVAGAAAAAPAAAAKRNWMGPLAGLAAGLGLAALFSHLGMGEGLANFMMMALLAVAAFFVIRMLMRRFGGGAQTPALAGAGAGAGNSNAPARFDSSAAPRAAESPLQRTADVTEVPSRAAEASGNVSVTGRPLGGASLGAATAGGAAVAASAVLAQTADTAATAAATTRSGYAQPQLPEGFDLPGFERVAKMIFIRLQAANDSADLDDLREFTTPEMFAAIRLDLQERQGGVQATDVESVDAEVIAFEQEATRQVVSVRFHGKVREEVGGPSTPFDEIWHLSKPADDSRSWAIAGIQQPQ